MTKIIDMQKMKKALITGINGQDGSYLAELLLDKGYEVHGIVRREAMEDAQHRLRNITHILEKVHVHVASVDNYMSLYRIVQKVKPDECYHFAASSFISYNFDDEISVISNNFVATHYVLASIKELAPECRFYFAGSSEMFGDPDGSPQNENSAFRPRSIYGISKVSSYHLVSNYRKHHKIFACTGILYNHESPRRGYQFVTRKITSSVAKIYLGINDALQLGNITAVRDWGYAPEYVDAIWRMLNHDVPDDYVISSGVLHSVEEFLDIAFSVVSLNYKDYVRIDEQYFRPPEQVPLVGDNTKARKILGWQPQKKFEDIVKEMVLSDIEILKSSK